MSSEMKKEILSRCEERERIKCEKAVETELTLPDYCSDIKRILKCTVTPGVHSVSMTGDRVNIKGTAVIRLIYIGEKDKIDCYEKTLELSLGGQCKQGDTGAVVLADAVTDYVNCRAVSQRKVSLSGSISVICRVMGESKKEILCECKEGIEAKKQKQTEESLVCHAEKTFDMSETVALDKGKPSIGKILRQQAYVSVESKKAVEDKLLIKGELTVKAVYCSDDGEGKTHKITHTMPISQIIDIEGVDEKCELRADCKVSQLLICGKSDSSDTGRLLDIAARVSCYITAYKTKEYEYISDCYCTENKHTAEYASRNVPVPVYSTEKLMTLRQTADLGSVKEICDVWVSDCTATMHGNGDRAKGNILLTVCFICLDEKGVPVYKEKEIEFQSDTELKEKYGELLCEFSAEPRKVSAAPEKEGVTEITVDVMTFIRIYNLCPTEYVCAVKEKEKSGGTKKNPALVIYYCESGEKVWDIAKKYSAPVSAVRQENGIEEETLSKRRMLLIPCI